MNIYLIVGSTLKQNLENIHSAYLDKNMAENIAKYLNDENDWENYHVEQLMVNEQLFIDTSEEGFK